MTGYYGKTLPHIFVDGYLCAFQSFLGNGTFQALHQHAARVLIPDQTARDQWLAPLKAQLTYGLPDPPFLDYALISLFHTGLIHGFPLKTVSLLSERIGMQWWSGEPPINIYYHSNNLHDLFTPNMLAQLRPHQWGGGRTRHSGGKSPQQLAILGITTCINDIQQQSDLAWMIEHEPDQMTLLLDDCPFCVGHTESCRVWWGVLQGLLDWLHSAHHHKAFSQKLDLDREHSAGHQLTIKYVD
ncbi:MAG: hypothetical protein AAGF95_33485 [Chloroflexota bacterium]